MTSFSVESSQIVGIFKWHLPILYTDQDIHAVLSGGCNFSSRRAPTLGNMLSSSLFNENDQNSGTWLFTKGWFYSTCRYCNKHKKSYVLSLTTGKTLKMNQYVNCNTTSVVYFIKCKSCKLQYVECAKHPLRIRISEHYNDTNNHNARNISNVSRHFRDIHKGNLIFFCFFGIEQVKKKQEVVMCTAYSCRGKCGGSTLRILECQLV